MFQPRTEFNAVIRSLKLTTILLVCLLATLLGGYAVGQSRADSSSPATASESGSSGSNGYGKLNQQAFKSSGKAVSTTSTEFAQLPHLSGLLLGNANAEVTAHLSAIFGGAALEIRVRTGTDGPVFKPGTVGFDPAGEGSPFAFSFVRKDVGVCATLNVEWRSVTGEEVTFNGGDLIGLFRRISKDVACI